MKIFVQDTNSKLFLKGCGAWTQAEDKALTFSTTKAALQFSLKNELTNVQLIIVFDDGTKYVRYIVPPNLKGKMIDRTGRFFVPARAERLALTPA
jgi:hypothetical protein